MGNFVLNFIFLTNQTLSVLQYPGPRQLQSRAQYIRPTFHLTTPFKTTDTDMKGTFRYETMSFKSLQHYSSHLALMQVWIISEDIT